MLFSRQGFKTVDTAEEFVKQVLEFGQKDIVLSVTHSQGVIDIIVSPTMDAIEADVYHFLNDETELKYTMPLKSLTANYISSLNLTSAIYAYLSEAFKVADMFTKTTRQSTDYAK
jgi:acyl CoA:acetate/3-ketoacid CoA transferase alpha subunit